MASLRVILVDPLYEGNIGHIARSMMNFGTTDLAIVQGPRLTDEGRNRAVHAQGVLDEARRVDTLAEAGEGCDLLVGFTARVTGKEERYHRNPFDVRDWAPRAAAHPGRLGLVFGREDRGLTNDEAGYCDQLVSIPTHEMYRSMNLAHAVTVALYSVYAHADPTRIKEYTPAEKAQVDRLVERFELLMQQSDFPEHKWPAVSTMFRRVLGRAEPTAWEIATLHGVFRDALYHLGVRRARPEAELSPELRTKKDAPLADPLPPEEEH